MSGKNVPGGFPVTLLARAPELGRVKTRLAAGLGEAAALEVAEALLGDVVARVLGWTEAGPGPRCPADRCLTVALTGSDPAMVRARQALSSAAGQQGLRFEAQPGGELGARIEHALSARAAEGAAASLVIGSDCPFLSDALLDGAVEALAPGGSVLVPARDGGFVLMGAPALPPGTLEGVDWGTPRVLAQTQAALARVAAPCRLLEPEEDVDDLEGLRRAAARLAGSPHAPRTLAWLAAHRALWAAPE